MYRAVCRDALKEERIFCSVGGWISWISHGAAEVVDSAFENHFPEFERPAARTLGFAVRALGWYRQFREIVLMFTLTNIEPLCEPL